MGKVLTSIGVLLTSACGSDVESSPGAGLRMPDQQTAYAQMIDTPSVSSLCAGTQRIEVGAPENSCLVLFYQGRLGSDDLDWVDDAEIELMREWIRQGALP
jgi:hypothetical protein